MGRSYSGLALLSAAALGFEVTLTRLFSITQWYHFAFLAVSIALLGYGASGTLLSLVPRWNRPPATHRAWVASLFFAASVLVAYLCLNHLPFDSYRIAWEQRQVLYLALYYCALTLPFLAAGLVTGMLLSAYPHASAQLYAANLIGSSLGAMLPLVILPWTGEGSVLLLAALGLVAALVFMEPRHGPTYHTANTGVQRRTPLWEASALLVIIGLLVIFALQPPPIFQLRLSPYKGLSQVLRFPETEIVWQRWNAISRIDLVAGPAVRAAPGLSLTYPGPFPSQRGLFVDGDNLNGILEDKSRLGDTPGQDITAYLPVTLPYQLRPGARVLLLEPQGDLDIRTALQQGAASVIAVVPNPLVATAGGPVYGDPRVRIHTDGSRSFARHTQNDFDIIHLALTDSYRPVTSGAYSLGERYDLTVEAFHEYLDRLAPGGLLVIERWLQLPPSEMLRAGATAIEAMQRRGINDPARRLVVLRDWQVGLILVKNGPLTPQEETAIRQFSSTHSLDLVALPHLAVSEINRYNILEEPVYHGAFQHLLSNSQTLYDQHPYDIRPATDDRPFFFHFFTWHQSSAILGQLGKTWQPWGGSGYFVLVALLGVVSAISILLLLLPVALSRRQEHTIIQHRLPSLVYFSAIGLGFLFAEIPLIQRFILYLDQPIYAFAIVVTSLLLFSGVGSLFSSRLSLQNALGLLVIVMLLYAFGLPRLFDASLGLHLTLRIVATGLVLGPIGFLMGIPFPAGLIWLRKQAPQLVPWAWTANGCASVLASILAAMVALSIGTTWVLTASALSYGIAWLALQVK